MSFTYRYRKPTSLIALTALFVTSTMTPPPATAEYIPHLGRSAQRDPNGTALVIHPGLVYHGASPMVTISMAYELQFADGLNFYQFVRSNPGIGTDPSGMFTYADLLTSQTVSAWLRTSMKFAAIGTVGAGVFGGLRSGYEAQLMGGNAKQIAIAAVRGAGYTGYKAFARVLIASAMIASGPGGLALAGGIGLFESAEAYGEARERQEQAQTQEELALATFDSVFATLGVGGSLYGTAAGIRGAAVLARGGAMPKFSGRPPRNLNEKLAVDEAMSGQGTRIMQELGDPRLQQIRGGLWDKWAHHRKFSDGSSVEIHVSRHRQTGLAWDIKIKE